MNTSNLMEKILSSDNLNRAYMQVVRNKGAEGVDGMKYTELKEHLEKNGENIKEQLRTRKYKPQPVRRVEIPKPDGGVRNLGVPTVTDRFIQQAIAQVLTPIYEEEFHDHSYGFRPNRCAQQAIMTALDMMNDSNDCDEVADGRQGGTGLRRGQDDRAAFYPPDGTDTADFADGGRGENRPHACGGTVLLEERRAGKPLCHDGERRSNALTLTGTADEKPKPEWRDFLPGFLKDGFGGFTFEIFIKRMKLPRFV